jgi:aminopeptidase N
VTSTNISREEAGQRAQQISVDSYQVVLDLTTGAKTFHSTTTIRFSADVDSTWIDIIAPALRSARLNGVELNVAAYSGSRLELHGLASSNELVVDADCAYMNTGEGLHRFTDPVDDEVYLYTQFETADARRMYACFEQPDLKATFQLTVTAPNHWQVVSNAPTPTPEPRPERESSPKSATRPSDPTPDTADDSAKAKLEPTAKGDEESATWVFEPTQVMSTYITALVAGPYHVVRAEYDGIGGTYPLGIFCRESLAPHLDSEAIFEITKQGFAFYESIFERPYPFGKYDQLFVPEFNAGAMENAGCVTFLEDYVFRSRVTEAAYEQRANTILHEMAHMWFGDLVTMKWWDDLWLNESFAEWASHYVSVKATKYTDAWTTFAILRKAWAYRQDQLPSTHPIAADMSDLDAVRVNFDGITYAKGASALKQLVAWVGEDEFLAGLRRYFDEFEWTNTELPDLLKHLEEASGRDLSDWTSQWLRTSGVNLLRPEITTSSDGAMEKVTVVQEPPTTPPGLEPILRDHRLGIGLYDLVEGQLVCRQSIEIDLRGERSEVPELAGVRQPDLLLLNDQDLTFAKIRMDERSAATAISSIGKIQDSLARTLVWGAAWDMVRDAEMSTGDCVSLVVSGLVAEPDVAVVQTILRQTKAAIDQYAEPGHRGEYAAELADTLWRSARAAEPGSDHQLAFVRALASMAETESQFEVLAGLLDGFLELPGLAVDTDLRWTLLQALVAEGLAGPDRVEEESIRDATATGKRQRTMALASIPTAEAKAAAWKSIMSDHELPNSILDATLGGFAQPGQEELLAPYVARYFQEVAQVWSDRTPEMAQSITTFLYPYLAVSEDTATLADGFLAGEDLHPAAARLVSEGADSTRRALRARVKDAD